MGVGTVLIAIVAFGASALTLLSGFGLGALLAPVFALFFPVQVAIAATAIVHLANNLFKLALVGRHVDLGVVARFGAPAALAGIAGAAALSATVGLSPLVTYDAFGRSFVVTPVKALIGTLIVVFSLMEMSPAFAKLAIPPRYMALGGIASGFLGGLSGHQGALRSAFLIKAGLSKEVFVGTGVACAVIVDCARLAVYGIAQWSGGMASLSPQAWTAVGIATAAAFAGALIGTRVLKLATFAAVRFVVGGGMALIGAALCAGLI